MSLRPPIRSSALPLAPSPVSFFCLPTGGDDSPSLQATLDAGRVAYLPGGRPFLVGGPVLLTHRDGVTVRGDGPSTVVTRTGGYEGPVFAVGLPWGLGEAGVDLRPAINPADWDGSVSGQRWAVATRGRASLALTGHSLQYGPDAPSGGPSAWAGPGCLTLDIDLEFLGGMPAAGFGICGTSDGHDAPLPWRLAAGDGCLALLLSADGGGRVEIKVPVDPGRRRFRLSLQVDPGVPAAGAWLDGRPTAVSGLPPAPFGLKAHDGFAPFVLGGGGALTGGRAVDAVVRGLRVGFGPAAYQWGAAAQTLADGRPATDQLRLFDPSPCGKALAGILPLTDAPVTPSRPFVRVDTVAGHSCLWWSPATQRADTTRIAFEDLDAGNILLGRVSDLRLTRVVAASGAEGLGSLPSAYSWPVRIEGGAYGGTHAAVNLFGAGVGSWVKGCSIAPGRYGVRLTGFSGPVEDLLITPPPPWAEVAVDLVPVDDGLTCDLLRVNSDNEQGKVYRRAVVRARAGGVAAALVSCTRLVVAELAPGTPAVLLVPTDGHPANPSVFTGVQTGSWAGGVGLSNGGGWDATADGRPVGPVPVTLPGPQTTTPGPR